MLVKRAGRENFLDGEPPVGKPLLSRVIQQCLENDPVLLDRVRPGGQDRAGPALPLVRRQTGLDTTGGGRPVAVSMLLGGFEDAHQLRGHFRIMLNHCVFDDDNVANGKNSAAAIVIRLHLAIVGP
jgi:hypothetical protein